MFVFGQSSLIKLDMLHLEVRETCELGLSWQIYDFTIVWTWRGKEVQNQAFLAGNSGKEWPDSKHNILDANGKPLSDAVDFAPWCMLPTGKMGIPWNDTHAFAVIGGLLLATSKQLDYNMRYGGDWDMDGLTTDQKLMDWGHLERMT